MRFGIYLPRIAILAGILFSAVVLACDFCEDLGNTLSQEIQRSDVAVIATVVDNGEKSVKKSDPPSAASDEDFRTVRLRVARFVKESPQFPRGAEITMPTNQTLKPDARYYLIGFGQKQVQWAAPQEVSERAERYIIDMLWAPKEGPARVAYFVPYLDDSEEFIAEDAYKVFAKAPYEEVKEIRDKLDREHILKRLQDEKLSTRLRRLYATLLGICGRSEDAAALLPFFDRNEQPFFNSLDATIACYLTLSGPAGMEYIESRYFIQKDTDKRHTSAAIRALKFHMTKEKVIPRERVLKAARYLLDRPELADLIIDDLIEWEDWTVSDKLVKLFKESDKENIFVRKPVIHYLKSCPLAESRPYIEELRGLDPETVELAELTFDGSGRKNKPASVPGTVATESARSGSSAEMRRPPLQTDTYAIKHHSAMRLFVFAALCLAGSIALAAVWFLIRKPK